VIVDNRLAAKTLRQHMIAQETVEDGRQRFHQCRRIAGGDDRLMKFLIVADPVDRA
jgi:hypothetical protein